MSCCFLIVMAVRLLLPAAGQRDAKGLKPPGRGA